MSLSREKIPVQPFTGPPRQAAKRSGQILVITLLAITVLVGLVFFVYNLGGRLSDRLSQQNAADAAAVSGAGWMARSMNVVAMNNVTQTRLLALIAVLDAMPLAAEMTIAEETGDDSLPLGLAKWQNVGPAFTVYEEDNFYRRGLAELYRQMNPSPQGDEATHLDLLGEIDRTLDHPDEKVTEDGFDVTSATRWSSGGGPTPTGTVW